MSNEIVLAPAIRIKHYDFVTAFLFKQAFQLFHSLLVTLTPHSTHDSRLITKHLCKLII